MYTLVPAWARKHINAPPAPALLSSSIIISACLPLAVKTALDNSLRQCQLNCNILPATIMRTGLQTHRNKHMAPRSRLGCCIHDFATVIPIFPLPKAILRSWFGQPVPAGNPTCQPTQYCPLSERRHYLYHWILYWEENNPFKHRFWDTKGYCQAHKTASVTLWGRKRVQVFD